MKRAGTRNIFLLLGLIKQQKNKLLKLLLKKRFAVLRWAERRYRSPSHPILTKSSVSTAYQPSSSGSTRDLNPFLSKRFPIAE